MTTGNNSNRPSDRENPTTDLVWTAFGDDFDAFEVGALRTITLGGVKYGMRYCPPGSFMMGSPADEAGRLDNETPHEVTLTNGFWMLETPCTQRLWKHMTGANPSYFQGENLPAAEKSWKDSVGSLWKSLRGAKEEAVTSDDLPVEQVSWEECVDFLKELNADELVPAEFAFRLPTEAEWEYACRAGAATPFSWGAALNGEAANCNGRFPYGTNVKGELLNQTTPVKKYAPNAWGLYDMHGNVWEWCYDWLGAYPSGSVTDPTGPERGKVRVGRGGCWYSNAELCRSAYRGQGAPTTRFSGLGFRFLLTLER